MTREQDVDVAGVVVGDVGADTRNSVLPAAALVRLVKLVWVPLLTSALTSKLHVPFAFKVMSIAWVPPPLISVVA